MGWGLEGVPEISRCFQEVLAVLWTECAAAITGTWTRRSGRPCHRPTTLTPVKIVATWDLDTQEIVLIEAMKTPLASTGGSRRKNASVLKGTHWRAGGTGARPGPHTCQLRRMPCLWIYLVGPEASKHSHSELRRTGCHLMARENRMGPVGTSGLLLPGPTQRNTAIGRPAWPRQSTGQRLRRRMAGG